MKRLLIVEDDKNILHALRKHFTRQEYIVLAVDNPKDAMDSIANFTPNIIISDWKLQDDLDGVDIVRTILDQISNVNIIFITGHNVHELNKKISNIEVHKVLKKPFELAVIDQAVRSAAM